VIGPVGGLVLLLAQQREWLRVEVRGRPVPGDGAVRLAGIEVAEVSPSAASSTTASSAKTSAAAKFSAMAKVVDPLPDISANNAPFARKNSWYNPSTGNLSNAGASSEL